MKLGHFIMLLFFMGVIGCARIGSPDGGSYDESAPIILATSPAIKSLNCKENKVIITFDEYVKLQKAVEKVVISPPQIEMPEIKENGRKITVKLLDSLKANTTYTIDFGDAIVDNNEGNPLGAYTFLFSTYDMIDTMQVSGYLLSAENLEPVKGSLVGLSSNLNDTAFTTLPFDRVSRTDDKGHFVIKGLSKKKYRVYALNDADNNFKFSQKSEVIAFSHDTIISSSYRDVRNDTVWHDSIRIDSIKVIPYMHYVPDDIVLRSFTESNDQRHLLKVERLTPQCFTIYFTALSDSLPEIKGLNFDASNAFLLEASAGKDTLCYWLKDTTLLKQDTLRFSYTYQEANDSTFVLEPKTDTLELVSRITYKKQKEVMADAWEEWSKNENKRMKKHPERTADAQPIDWLKVNVSVGSGISPMQNPSFEAFEPIASIDTSKIHLLVGSDSNQVKADYILREDSICLRRYTIYGAWRPTQHYTLKIDSAALISIFGKFNKASESKFTIRGADSYGTFFVNIPKEFDGSIVQLLSSSDKPRKQEVLKDGVAEFYYVSEGDYYMRLIVDENGNGKWDTGCYEEDLQPERVYYFPMMIKIPKKWDVSQDWNPVALPLYQQKPIAITKQKPTKERKKISKNAQRQLEKEKRN